MPRAKKATKKPEPVKTIRISLKKPAAFADEKREFWKNAYLSSLGGIAANQRDYTASEADSYARDAAMFAVRSFDQVVLEEFDEEEE